MTIPSGQKKDNEKPSKAIANKHNRIEKPNDKQSKLSDIGRHYLDNCYDIERNTWYMIRVIETDEQLYYDHAEELSNGSLYIGQNGEPCSLDRAAVVKSRSLALAYIQCMPIWKGRKLKNAILAIERFECEFDEIQESVCCANWLGQIQSLLDRHKVELRVV